MNHPILQYLPSQIAKDLGASDPKIQEGLEEVRLRRDAPVCLCSSSLQGFLKKGGGLSVDASTSYFCSEKELLDALNMVTSGSVYALAEEFRRGYITPVSYTHLDVYKRQLRWCRPKVPGRSFGGYSGNVLRNKERRWGHLG